MTTPVYQNKSYKPSDSFISLNGIIIEYLIDALQRQNSNYVLNCVKDDTHPCMKIGYYFDKYRGEATPLVSSKRLDRHKLASCLCAAILKVRPIIDKNTKDFPDNINELLAIYCGINLVKLYMIVDKFGDDLISANRINDSFEMILPSLDDKICDQEEYENNLINALKNTRSICKHIMTKYKTKYECLYFDIFAYSKIFYHLELFNKIEFEKLCDEYKKYHSENNVVRAAEI